MQWTSIESPNQLSPRRKCDSFRNLAGNLAANPRATSRGYVAISMAVIPAIIAVIDHFARGMWRGCDRTLAREAHASRERTCSLLHAARVIYYAINERGTRGRALGKPRELKVLPRDRAFLAPGKSSASGNRRTRLEQDRVRSRPSRREKLVAAP